MIKNIVMVEDDEDDRRIFHNLLLPYDDLLLNVYTCSLLSSCLATVFEKKPDLVVLDLNLPDSRGIDTLNTLIKRFPEQNILVMTGDLDEDYRFRLVELGAINAFEKGAITVADFRKSVVEALYPVQKTYLQEWYQKQSRH